MKKTLVLFLICFGIFGLIKGSQAATCIATVDLAIKSFDNSIMPQAKFAVYEQVYDANNLPKPGKQIGSGATDKYTGIGSVKLNVTEDLRYYAVRVTNPSLKQADFWYFNELNLNCDKQVGGTVVLSGFKVRVSDAGTLTAQKDIKFTIYSQAKDTYSLPIKGLSQGSFTTGSNAEVIVYAPSDKRSLPATYSSYFFEFKDSKGLVYNADSLNPIDSQLVNIDYRLSEIFITLRDGLTGNSLPNVKLNLMQQLPNRVGSMAIGKQLLSFTTDNSGYALFSYPAGSYILQLQYPDGHLANYNIVINQKERTVSNIIVNGYDQAKCKGRVDFKPSFRDTEGKILNSLSYTLYEESFDMDGNPKPDLKLISGRVDGYGSAKISFIPSPAKYYAMEVCDNNVKLACFWFFNLSFDCNASSVALTKILPATNIIVRTADKKLAIGQKINVYLESFNIDGLPIIDSSKQIASFNLPASGQVALLLPANNWQGEQIKYILVAPQRSNVNPQILFSPQADQKNVLDYIINKDKIVNYNNLPVSFGNLSGRIIIATENKNESWYVSPKNGKRYLIGSSAVATKNIRKLAIGISNKNLDRIPLAIAGLNGIDNDNDGLPNNLEIALKTNSYSADTDNDSFSDYQEIIDGFNPLVNGGKLPIDTKFSKVQAGKFFIQVEGKGELWYVFPMNNKRYFLGSTNDIVSVMRELGLPISNKELNKIPVGQ